MEQISEEKFDEKRVKAFIKKDMSENLLSFLDPASPKDALRLAGLAISERKLSCASVFMDHLKSRRIHLNGSVAAGIALWGAPSLMGKLLVYPHKCISQEVWQSCGLHAAGAGHTEVLKSFMLLRPFPSATLDDCLIRASQNGHKKMLSLLLKFGADPKAEESLCLQVAFRAGHFEIVETLLPKCDKEAALLEMERKYNTDLSSHFKTFVALSSRKRMQKKFKNKGVAVAPRKM